MAYLVASFPAFKAFQVLASMASYQVTS